jgi:hypothetical protein
MHNDSSTLTGATFCGEWRHRGCFVGLEPGRSPDPRAYAVRHASGLPMGRARSLQEARQLIDEESLLVRQRLAAPT